MTKERSWYIQEETLTGRKRRRFNFTDYRSASAAYGQYQIVDDFDHLNAHGRVWLCREDGTALKVNITKKQM